MDRYTDKRILFDLMPSERAESEEQHFWRRKILLAHGKNEQEGFFKDLLEFLHERRDTKTESSFDILSDLFGPGLALHLSATLNMLDQGGKLEGLHPLWRENPAKIQGQHGQHGDERKHYLSRRQEREHRETHPHLYSNSNGQEQSLLGRPEPVRRRLRYTGSPVSDTTKNMLHELARQFGLKDMWFAVTCEDEWLKKQLTELKMGLSHLSSLLGVSENDIGQKKLSFYFYQYAETNVTALAQDTIIIGGKGYSVARLWSSWKASLCGDRIYAAFWEASREWRHTPYMRFRRQTLALQMFKRQFKNLVDHMDLSTDAGDKVARRYRAFGKWTDDVLRGLDLAQTTQGWQKVKTGNRIAWSGSAFDARFLHTWQAHERDIENVFWRTPRWDLPAWVQAGWDDSLSPRHIQKFIGIAFEAWVRDYLEHDSWLARDSADRPLEEEAEEVFSTLQRRMLPLLIA